MNSFRYFLFLAGLFAFACLTSAQAAVVNVRASYFGGEDGSSLALGDPIGISLSGLDQADSKDFELTVGEPVLVNVRTNNINNYKIEFSLPSGLAVTVDGVKQSVYVGVGFGSVELKITLVREEKQTANDRPIGEAASVSVLPPSLAAGSRCPYLAFNLGAARNGDPLPALRIPMAKRTSIMGPLVLPDTPALTNQVAENGGFTFSVPQADVKLEVDPTNNGNFDLTFSSPGTTTALVTYHFQIVTWNGDGIVDLKKVKVVKEVTGGIPFETTLQGTYNEGGVSFVNGSWTIEDWHTTTSSPGRIVSGTRTRVINNVIIMPSEWRVVMLETDTVEVKPSTTSTTPVTKTTSVYNWWEIGTFPNFAYIITRKQTTEGVGDGDYVNQSFDDPNFENVRGAAAASGKTHIESDTDVSSTSYDTWLDSSPAIVNNNGSYGITTTGAAVTTELKETDSRWAAYGWPKSIERKLGATLLEKRTFAYSETDGIVTATRHDYSSPSAYLETVTKRHLPNDATFVLRDRVYSVQSPTGAKESYAYTTGSFSGSLGASWTADFRIIKLSGATSGGSAVTGTDGVTVDLLQMHAKKSTKTVEYLQNGRLVHRQVWIYTSGSGISPAFNSGDPVSWETVGYTSDGRLQSRKTNTGSSYTASWTGTRKTQENDETGLVTTFKYDDFDQMKSKTQASASDVPAQSVSFSYDADHRIRFQRVGAVNGDGDPTGEQLTTETQYDLAGKVKYVKAPGQGTTSSAGTIVTKYIYTNGGRNVQTTYADGTLESATKLVTRRTDGRLASITGTAVVQENYSYDFDSFSNPRVTRTLGPAQKRQLITTFDLLSRTLVERRNGFGVNGGTKPLVTYYEYGPTTGLLTKKFTNEEGGTTIQVTGTEIFTYDAFGQLTATGIDRDANDALDPSSTDRFQKFDTSFVYENDTWWRRVTTQSYYANNSDAVHTTKSDTRLTGLSGMSAQTVDFDYYDNITTRSTVIDATGHTHRMRTQFPDGTTEERTVVGELLASIRSFDDAHTDLSFTPVSATSYTYDALGRATNVADARTGSAQINYWYGSGLPREQYDARSVLVASRTYDGAGRLASTTTPAGAISCTYTPRGELYEQLGSGTFPSRRTYTSYGELYQLSTYRNGEATTADTTTWTYDDGTGWLTAKTDPANAMVTYDHSFSAGYQDVIVQSARDPSHATTRRYDVGTGDLLKIDYTDGTTDVDFQSYDREGNPTQVQDATGVRTLKYTNGHLETETLPSWFNSLVLTNDYYSSTDTSANTVKGRYQRWKLGVAGDLDREMSLSYGYDDFGRVNGVTADYRAQGSREALNVSASYTYKPNSSLWKKLTQSGKDANSFTLEREFENNRDVLSWITGSHTTIGTVTTFGYGTDDAGRHEWATQSGMAFEDFVDTAADATYYRYHYDARGQLANDSNGTLAAQGYRGTDHAKTTNPMPGRGFGYTYDDAGNRKSVSVGNESVSYWNGESGTGSAGGNNLNQTRSRGTLKTRVSGTSDKNATVTVGGGTASRESTPGRYWDYAWPNYQQSTSATVTAVLSGSTTESGTVQVLVRPATETLKYDADGNLMSDSLWTYEYDAENRLKRMSTNTTATAWGAPDRELLFAYDYLGRRVRKVSKQNGSTIYDRKFIYRGWALMAELDTAANKIVRSYAWGLDVDSTVGGSGGVGGLVLETIHSDTALTAYHVSYDGGGNVTALVNRNTNQIAASYEYGPFGENVRTQTFDPVLQAQGQPFRFSTKFTDSETGLVYYGRRFYDPSLGRFINRDPIEEAGGNNLYALVHNSPTNFRDLLGMMEDGQEETFDGTRYLWWSDGPNGAAWYEKEEFQSAFDSRGDDFGSDTSDGWYGEEDDSVEPDSNTSHKERVVDATGKDYFGSELPRQLQKGDLTFNINYRVKFVESATWFRYLFKQKDLMPSLAGAVTTVNGVVRKTDDQKMVVTIAIEVAINASRHPTRSDVPMYVQYAEYQHIADLVAEIKTAFDALSGSYQQGGPAAQPDALYNQLVEIMNDAYIASGKRYDGSDGQHAPNGTVLRPKDFPSIPDSWW